MCSVWHAFHGKSELVGACFVRLRGSGSLVVVPNSWPTSLGIRGRLTSTIPMSRSASPLCVLPEAAWRTNIGA